MIGKLDGIDRPDLMPQTFEGENRGPIANVAKDNMGLDT